MKNRPELSGVAAVGDAFTLALKEMDKDERLNGPRTMRQGPSGDDEAGTDRGGSEKESGSE